MLCGVLTFLLLLCEGCTAELDDWQYIYRGSNIKNIAVNKKALYLIDAPNKLYILEKESGFEVMEYDVNSVDVNEDFGMWFVKTNGSVFYRSGMSSTTMKGDKSNKIDGNMNQITTGRRGLVVGLNKSGNAWVRNGISSSAVKGSSWSSIEGEGLSSVSCARQVCFAVTTSGSLSTTGHLGNIGSLTTTPTWLPMNVSGKSVSAFGGKTLWKVSKDGYPWQATNVLDPGFRNFNWERRGYQTTKFKSIAVTGKKEFAVSEDGRIFIHTGCPIFDFEDNDITEWEQTGTAFAYQPVVDFVWSPNANVTGIVGKRMIDSYSKRSSISKPADFTSKASDTPTGTLTSPMFQIRTAYLHFSVGGGSFPTNYVALIVGGSEVRKSSGENRFPSTAYGGTLMARFWWDVQNIVNECATVKIYDLSTGWFGYTMFDDLRSSPPCFNSMKANLREVGPNDVISAGTLITESITLEGFTTSKLRKLVVSASFPVLQGFPLVYIEKVNLAWTHCQSNIKLKTDLAPLSSNRQYKMTTQIPDLLSDARLDIVARVYDHDALQAPKNNLTAWMSFTVNYADEFVKRLNRMVTIKRHGNETAHLVAEGSIVQPRTYTVGENVTIEVLMYHNYTLTLKRAHNIQIRLNLPPYMTLVATHGLNASLDETQFAAEPSVQVARIPELLLADNKTVKFHVRIDGEEPRTGYSRASVGAVVLDVTYCKRRNCSNSKGDGVQVSIALGSKTFEFQYTHEKKPEALYKAFTAIIEKSGSLVFLCGDYYSAAVTSKCYFKDMTSKAWRGLGTTMTNISFYDPDEKELYGAHHGGSFMKMSGKRFADKQMLSAQQWASMVASSAAFDKAFSVLALKKKNVSFYKGVKIANGNGQKLNIGPDGIASLLTDAHSLLPEVKWRCCH